jgi:glycosyltransferase involved in cell wall biosynthesis
MRVLWLVRRGLTASPGGDTTQIVQTAAALSRRGVHVEISDAVRPDLRGFDLAHLFHLDRLWENDLHARRLRAARLPYVLSTIWWPAAEFDAAARAGLQGVLARTFGSAMYANLRIWQRAAAHVLATGAASALHPRLLRFRTAVRHLLDGAAAILPNSRAEQDEIRRAFGLDRPCVVVPNAADASIFRLPAPEKGPRSGVLCVGRIEPRKNQLALIRALRDTDIDLTIVGPEGRYNRAYARACRAAAGPRTRFMPAQPPEVLRELYQQSIAHACVSWYETPGLASLEAALCGCALVVTPGGCTREYFGNGAEYADPADERSIRTAVQAAMLRPLDRSYVDRLATAYSWDAAATATLEGYELALGAAASRGNSEGAMRQRS